MVCATTRAAPESVLDILTLHDWAGDLNDRKSTSGYLFQICGTAVSWRSKKQFVCLWD